MKEHEAQTLAAQIRREVPDATVTVETDKLKQDSLDCYYLDVLATRRLVIRSSEQWEERKPYLHT